ncbi:G-protein coupled receptor GRL101-like isoform X2 [Actinia tenebrosa]|nr:G-protein coupled receptor GRL101-like isoform X2 [Actinia tenebrosa]
MIPNGFFRNQSKLRVLYLSNNILTKITKESFIGLSSLEELYLDHNDIHEDQINHETFAHLPKLRQLRLDSFMACCYAKKTIKGLQCKSLDDNYLSSCEDLLKILALRVFIWILGVLALLGNIGVIFYWNRLADIDPGDRGKKSRVQSFLLTNLAVSDLLMGIYLIIIAVHDSMWQDKYFTHDYEWRISITCQLAGALSMLSSEASVLILTTITADRFNSIVFHIKARPFNMKSARIVCAAIWVLSLLMSLAPFSFDLFYGDDRRIFFYGRSSVCLPLQLSSARPTGWEYAVFVYIAFNGFAFLFILLAYIAIFFKVKTSSKQVRSNMKKDSSLALRVVLIIVTDFCCWIPVVIIGCLSLTGQFRDSSGQAYAWIAVFVLPINSSINPLLYTFSNPQFRKLFNVRKLFDMCTGRTNEQSRKVISPKSNDITTGISGIDHMRTALRSPAVTPVVERKYTADNQYYDTRL